MPDKRAIRKLLDEEAEKLRRLNARIHETFHTRDRSPQDYAEWSAACRQFHHYRSPLWPYIYRAYEEKAYSDPDLLEFAVSYVEVAPRFFRSGYHMERILVGLKRSPLTGSHRRRLRQALVTAVRERGGREFRRYCRLAPHVADFDFLQDLAWIAAGPDPRPASRARLMLEYVDRHGPQQGLCE